MRHQAQPPQVFLAVAHLPAAGHHHGAVVVLQAAAVLHRKIEEPVVPLERHDAPQLVGSGDDRLNVPGRLRTIPGFTRTRVYQHVTLPAIGEPVRHGIGDDDRAVHQFVEIAGVKHAIPPRHG